MARDTKKRLQKLQKRAAKRKQKRREISKRHALGNTSTLAQTRNWPFYEILITKDWQIHGTLVQIIFARRNDIGQYAVGGFLVDLDCLGVKTGYGNISDRQTYVRIRDEMAKNQELIPAEANLVAKIVREGVEYAKSLGLKPDPDYRDGLTILGDVDPSACTTPVRLGGENGKPFFVAGPYDNIELIIKKLTWAVGPDGFDFIAPIRPPADFGDDW